MPIDPKKVQWDDEAPVAAPAAKAAPTPTIDRSKIQWDDEQAAEPLVRGRTLLQTLGEGVINLPSSLVKLGKDTIEGFKSLPESAPEAATRFLAAKYGDPRSRKVIVDAAKSLGGYFADTYGDYESAKNKFATDPAGFLADISTIFGLGAAVTPGKAGVVLERAATLTDPTRPVTAAVEKTIRGAGKITGRAIDVSEGKRIDVKAGKIAREAAGEALPELTAAMRGPQPITTDLAAPGATMLDRRAPTAAEAAAPVEAPEFQALAARVAQRPGEPRFYGLAEEAAQKERAAQLAFITPDLEAAKTTRELATEPLYQSAFKTVVPLDQELNSLFSRMPREVLSEAASIAKIEGRPFQVGSRISGESLHYIKRALSDIVFARPGTSKIGIDQQRAAGSLLREYLTTVENKIPAYGEARRKFAELSRRVNQAQVLTEMRSVLTKPEGGERAQQFLNVLGRGEEALLKRTTGAPRFEAGDLAKVLEPDQMRVVLDISNELANAAKIKNQAQRGQAALNAILRANQFQYALPDFLNPKITVANAMLARWREVVDRKTLNRLAEAFRTAESAEELLSAVPAQERNKLLRAMTSAEINRGILLTAAQVERANQLTSEQQNRNALAPAQR
jgi:hypothetical protein